MWLVLSMMLACKPTPGAPGAGAPSGSTTDSGASTTAGSTLTMADFAPAPAALHRLTEAHYRAATEAVVGLRYEGELPVDYQLHGYAHVGAGELSIGPLDLELYEAAAWELATLSLPDDDSVEALLGCPYDSACLESALGPFLRRAWRRPPTDTEITELLALADSLAPALGERIAVQAVVAAVLQSPDFLFRVEIGVPDPVDPSVRWLDDYELASKLAFFVTGAPPDPALLDAAEAGELTGGGLTDEARRLLALPGARDSLITWFGETLELQDLATLDKDPLLYPELDALEDDLRAEIDELFVTVALDGSGDLRDVFTTDQAFPSPELAELVYGVTTGGGVITLPASQERGGVLGRAGLLALGAHNTVTSPTHRGKLVRTRLLCSSVPPPPPGVVTELSEHDDEATLRERLEQHATDPQCSGCHLMMDPIGYGFEHFDPIGRHRELDNGKPVDATGELDGVAFDGGAELALALVEHPRFAGCMTSQLYRYAMGHAELESEQPAIDLATELFVDSDHQVEALVEAIVGSEAFLTVGAPEVEPCVDGEQRDCSTLCDVGLDVCVDGEWMGCDAPEPTTEDCNGVDDDCDGLVDEDLVRSCTTAWGPGEEVCEAGAWSPCEGEVPLEVCNGVDDDADGLVDEDLEVGPTPTTYAELTVAHYSCDAAVDSWNGPCNAAVHRHCASLDCSVTGFGPVAADPDGMVVCLDDSEGVVVSTTFTELAGHHPDCSEADTHGGSCNAAISRMCGSMGLTTGYGPVENSGDVAVVVCTPGATVINGSYAVLATYDSVCDGSWERWGPSCARAIHGYCVDEGYESGHGPLENSGDLAVIACLGAP